MVTCRLGKPHPEQGQIGPAPSPLLSGSGTEESGPLSCPPGQAGRVGRLSPAATPGLEEWSSGRAARSGCTGSGLQTDFGLFPSYSKPIKKRLIAQARLPLLRFTQGFGLFRC